MKRKFIINPSAGRGITPDTFDQLKSYFFNKLGNFDYVLTKNKQDIEDQTRIALRNGTKQIVAVGGDGTIQAVVNGFFYNGKMINPSAILAVSKMGTGSDYYKTVSNEKNVNDWKSLVTDFKIKKVDLGYIKFRNSKRKGQYFANMASSGLSALVARKKDKLPKWTPSILKYVLPTIHSFFSFKPELVEFITDSHSFRSKLSSLFVCKGIYAGGGMKFGGNVTIDDGMFDITIMETFSPIKLMFQIHKLYSGKLESISGVRKIKTNKLRIKSPTSIGFELDGEFDQINDFEFSMKEKAINICFPA